MKFYSEVTKKIYDSEKELIEAEKALNESKDKRASRAKEVEDAFKVARDAQKKANQLLSAFVKDYGSFKTTIKDEDPFFWSWLDFLR